MPAAAHADSMPMMDGFGMGAMNMGSMGTPLWGAQGTTANWWGYPTMLPPMANWMAQTN